MTGTQFGYLLTCFQLLFQPIIKFGQRNTIFHYGVPITFSFCFILDTLQRICRRNTFYNLSRLRQRIANGDIRMGCIQINTYMFRQTRQINSQTRIIGQDNAFFLQAFSDFGRYFLRINEQHIFFIGNKQIGNTNRIVSHIGTPDITSPGYFIQGR